MYYQNMNFEQKLGKIFQVSLGKFPLFGGKVIFDYNIIIGIEKYTHEQLFFMSFAQLWCGKIQKEAAIEWLQTDQHSLYHGRVNLALINQKEFAKAFHCPAGSAMNPGEGKRCTVW